VPNNYPDGTRNRLNDLRCAWRKAQPFEREAFLAFMHSPSGKPVGPPPFHEKWSGHRFDWCQSRAYEITDADREAGNPAPDHGYSAEAFAQAEREAKAPHRREEAS